MLADFIMSLSAQTLAQSYLVWWVICCAIAYKTEVYPTWKLVLFGGTALSAFIPVAVLIVAVIIGTFFKIIILAFGG